MGVKLLERRLRYIYVNMEIENRIYCSKHRFIGAAKNLRSIKDKIDRKRSTGSGLTD